MTSLKEKLPSVRKIIYLHFAVLLVAVGVYFFKFPNHFTMGGVSGFSVLLGELGSWSPSTWTIVLNLALLVVGRVALGSSFTFGTAYVSLLLSFFLYLFGKWVPLTAPLTRHPLLELAFAALLPATGSAILFNMQLSTGGTDILAMILKKKIPLNIGKILASLDILVAIAAIFVFSVETALLSLAGLLIKGFFVDMVMTSSNEVKYFTIVSSKAQEITSFITEELERGATLLDGRGAYSGEEKGIILCVVERAEAVKFRDYTKKVDPHSFVMISNTSQIIGRGFGSIF